MWWNKIINLVWMLNDHICTSKLSQEKVKVLPGKKQGRPTSDNPVKQVTKQKINKKNELFLCGEDDLLSLFRPISQLINYHKS